MRWKQPLTFVVAEDLLEVAAPAETEAVLVGTAAEDWRAERLCQHMRVTYCTGVVTASHCTQIIYKRSRLWVISLHRNLSQLIPAKMGTAMEYFKSMVNLRCKNKIQHS